MILYEGFAIRKQKKNWKLLDLPSTKRITKQNSNWECKC